MTLSVFDLYSIGIGPSSSHTIGPMKAARTFVEDLSSAGILHHVTRVQVELFGSLGATGHGHGSEKAVMLGLEGDKPAMVDPTAADMRVDLIRRRKKLTLGGNHPIAFDPDRDLILHKKRSLPAHPNGMIFTAQAHETPLRTSTLYSIGGGFVVDESAVNADRVVIDNTPVRYPFSTGQELLDICHREHLRISDVMLANELSWRSEDAVHADLLHIWAVMQECVRAGCRTEGVLPGCLGVRRRAPRLHHELSTRANPDPLDAIDWVCLFALAVNEENASGGRVVTAPTNGAAGVIPAVLHYYARFVPGSDDDGIVRFLLTAAAIGILFKENASISGAEVGCQGEIGSACSMASGALCEAMGGTVAQVENAAEIGIEHNLGLTCDPVGGLVQIPCIERNAVASVKAINAARLAINGTGEHRVSLDMAIKTMRDTGRDMHVKYKETSRGGLAVNFIEC